MAGEDPPARERGCGVQLARPLFFAQLVPTPSPWSTFRECSADQLAGQLLTSDLEVAEF